ncbi:unnamed protein product [Brassica rapa subsp. trilocularis]|uniref:(rape) hypothetical protein n=1 Tax=Brassica napus TaxID=3708 RepID=A0A817BK76_BRANA|nr:unnamed protein product [Brassica napus]
MHSHVFQMYKKDAKERCCGHCSLCSCSYPYSPQSIWKIRLQHHIELLKTIYVAW